MIPPWPGELPTPQERTVDEMRSVLAYPECPCSDPLYLMYRDLARSEEDRGWLHAHHLRYDITVIPAKVVCGEYVKTKGHYHPENPAGTGYPELYEVLSGEAHYLLQNRDLSDAIFIRAKTGDKVVIPPGYGHVTINPSNLPLAMANLVSRVFSSLYIPYEERQGAAYYELLGGQMVKNSQYPPEISLRCSHPTESAGLGVVAGISIYELVEDREDLSFLTHPERFLHLFRDLLTD